VALVSVGQVENLQDALAGLCSVSENLAASCGEQLATIEEKLSETQREVANSDAMLTIAWQAEIAAQLAVNSAQCTLRTAEMAAPASPIAAAAAIAAGEALRLAQAVLEKATENRMQMEQRLEMAHRALQMAERLAEQARQECAVRLAAVEQAAQIGRMRLTHAQQALDAYLATNPPAAQFHSWLNWQPTTRMPVTPDMLRDRTTLSAEQHTFFQEYLYDREPAYRGLVDKYRTEWHSAKGDAERNNVARNVRIHLSGAFAEHSARRALEPLGKVETQGRTFVGTDGRYTKTDLFVSGLKVPVILGRGERMSAPVGGSLAVEVKCGRPDYLYQQKDHLLFQAEGHKAANASMSLCSRDIKDLSEEKETELRDALRSAGSAMVGMLPKKNEIDQSCLQFIFYHGGNNA
jgi:hypothetical protein